MKAHRSLTELFHYPKLELMKLFPTVVADYFRQKRERREAASPATGTRSANSLLSRSVFDDMTEAIGGNDAAA